jgi:glyoxylase-like metal-dependent hydrolase (beta-lactamase superfamily II)
MSDTYSVRAKLPRGAQQVAPDVLALRIAFVNMFFIGAPEEGAPWVLVDAGVGECSARIVEVAEACFGAGTRPEAIILTHGHFDHVGAVRTLAERWDVPVYVHLLELPYLVGRSSYPPADPVAGEGAMAWLSPLYPRRPIDLGGHLRALPADGQVPFLPRWQAIHTPGHTPGHISLFRPDDGLLIAGDAVVTTNQESALAVATQRPEVRRPPAYFTPDWLTAARSVERLAELAPAALASGHGPTMRGPEMQAQLAKLAQRFAEVGLPKRGRYVPTAVRVRTHMPSSDVEIQPESQSVATGVPQANQVALVQGCFYVATGLWPLVSIQSFEAVTGPKAERWLVQTVGLELVIVGGALAMAGWRRASGPEIRLLGMGSAAALAAIDLIFTARGRISPVYLLDALVEGAVLLAWTGSRA